MGTLEIFCSMLFAVRPQNLKKKKNSYLKFDVSKHDEGNKTAIKQPVTGKIKQCEAAEEKIRVSCDFCNYTD